MEFEWDGGNQVKSLIKHGVAPQEAEQAFGNPYILEIDEGHSLGEVRFNLIGKTVKGNVLYVIFTTRHNKIRIISARAADKRERQAYEEKIKENPKI